MNNFVETIKWFDSQGSKYVYHRGKALTIIQQKWSWHIHNLEMNRQNNSKKVHKP